MMPTFATITEAASHFGVDPSAFEITCEGSHDWDANFMLHLDGAAVAWVHDPEV